MGGRIERQLTEKFDWRFAYFYFPLPQISVSDLLQGFSHRMFMFLHVIATFTNKVISPKTPTIFTMTGEERFSETRWKSRDSQSGPREVIAQAGNIGDTITTQKVITAKERNANYLTSTFSRQRRCRDSESCNS